MPRMRPRAGHLFSLPAGLPDAVSRRRCAARELDVMDRRDDGATMDSSHVARHRANSKRLSRSSQKLRAAGYEAYLAGGCVRDLLLGREPKDYDVATSATPDVVLNLFPRTFAVGAHLAWCWWPPALGQTHLRCATAPCGRGAWREASDYVVTEVATFRSDGAYSDGRHPDAVRYTTSAEEDVRRRDFTINGLLLRCRSRGRGALQDSSEELPFSAGVHRPRGRPRRSGSRAWCAPSAGRSAL